MKTIKKIAASLITAALMTAFSACTSEDTNLPDAGEADGVATFTFNCLAPGSATDAATRAYSDGRKADNLYYAVYTMNTGTPVLVETNVNADNLADGIYTDNPKTFSNDTYPKAELKLQLAIGQQYTILFFGAATDAPYTFSPADGMITVSYDGAKCNDENRDAFYTKLEFTAKKSETNLTATLHRPFAQVNVGTSKQDFNFAKKQGVEPTQTRFSVKEAYTKLDMFTGDVSEPTTAVFSLENMPDGEVFPVFSDEAKTKSHYKYLAMNYVLVQGNSQTFTCSFGANTFSEADDWQIENVPMQRNHRTNIYGGGIYGPGVDHPGVDPDDPDYPYTPENPYDPENPDTTPDNPGGTDPDPNPYPYDPDNITPGLLSFFQNLIIEIDPDYFLDNYDVTVDF